MVVVLLEMADNLNGSVGFVRCIPSVSVEYHSMSLSWRCDIVRFLISLA